MLRVIYEVKGTSEGGKKMNGIEDPRIGKYISITGVIHTIASCGGKRGRFGTSKASLITAEDAAWFNERGIDHKFCGRCN